MIEVIKDYLYRKMLGDAWAIMAIALLLIFWSDALIALFNLNAWWVTKLWAAYIAPNLPIELRLAGEAMGAAHHAMLSALRFSTGLVKKGADASTIEAGARILLLGEAWILKVQLSLAFRMVYQTYRVVTRKQPHRRHDPLFG